METTSDAPGDIKDFCEHIRTAQLSLLGICLLLLSVVARDKPRPLSVAIENVRSIAKVGASKIEIAKTLQAYANSAFDTYAQTHRSTMQMEVPVYILAEPSDGSKLAIRLNFPARWIGNSPFYDHRSGAPFGSDAIYKVDTIGEFKEFWDACFAATLRFAPAFQGTERIWLDALDGSSAKDLKVLMWSSNFATYKRQVNLIASPSEITSAKLLEPRKVDLMPTAMRDSYYGITGQSTGEIFIQMQELNLPLNILPGFLQSSEIPRNWKPIAFAQMFGELSTQLQGISALSFDDAEAYLKRQSEAMAPEEPVEIFGAKLPVERINQWGTVIMLGLQLYLLILLIRLRQLASVYKINVLSWSGMFPGTVSHGFTMASCAILPTAVIGYLAIHRLSTDSSSTFLYLVSLLFSVLVSVGVVARLAQIWRNLH